MESDCLKQSIGAGTDFTVTNATAAITLGTTTPSLILTFGTWVVFGRVTLRTAAATIVGTETVTVAIKDASSNVISTLTILLPAMTTTTKDIGSFTLPIAINDNSSASMTPDTLVFHAVLSASLGAGSLTLTTEEITAIKIF